MIGRKAIMSQYFVSYMYDGQPYNIVVPLTNKLSFEEKINAAKLYIQQERIHHPLFITIMAIQLY
jgi:hypothetical protein